MSERDGREDVPVDVIAAELERIGLCLADVPALAIPQGAGSAFLARLRRLAVGASWTDVSGASSRQLA